MMLKLGSRGVMMFGLTPDHIFSVRYFSSKSISKDFHSGPKIASSIHRDRMAGGMLILNLSHPFFDGLTS